MQRTIKLLAQAALLAGFAIVAQAQTMVPSGTPINIILNQQVSSKTAKVGDKIPASVAANVTVNGKTVIPEGASASVSVQQVQPSGRLSTPAELVLHLDSVTVNGQTYTITSGTNESKGKSHKKRNILAIGGGTAAGALIGGLAGGGKGAAIGAGAGAAAGTAGAAATGKKDITYPAETKITFMLESSLTMR